MKEFKFKVNRVVPCNGTSIWTDSNAIKPKVTEITIEQENSVFGGSYILVWVKHNGPWDIYTDSGFERGISKIVTKKIGKPVRIVFTEQGMQGKRKASMEPGSRTSEKTLLRFMNKK